jgi:hypothetical protein
MGRGAVAWDAAAGSAMDDRAVRELA